jgi:hypothetical protein
MSKNKKGKPAARTTDPPSQAQRARLVVVDPTAQPFHPMSETPNRLQPLTNAPSPTQASLNASPLDSPRSPKNKNTLKPIDKGQAHLLSVNHADTQITTAVGDLHFIDHDSSTKKTNMLTVQKPALEPIKTAAKTAATTPQVAIETAMKDVAALQLNLRGIKNGARSGILAKRLAEVVQSVGKLVAQLDENTTSAIDAEAAAAGKVDIPSSDETNNAATMLQSLKRKKDAKAAVEAKRAELALALAAEQKIKAEDINAEAAAAGKVDIPSSEETNNAATKLQSLKRKKDAKAAVEAKRAQLALEACS